jgi:DNA-binding NarL/FixJ family response regulator
MTPVRVLATLAIVMPEHSQPSRFLRVLIVDDHRCGRQGLSALLALQGDIEVVGEAANEREAVELANRHAPHVVVMAVERPPVGGPGAIPRIKTACPLVHVIALSIHDEVRERAMDEGADAFLVKGQPEGLLEVLRRLRDEVDRAEDDGRAKTQPAGDQG